MLFSRQKSEMITPQDALPGHAERAFTVPEALAAIRAPDFVWPAGLYRQPMGVNR